MSSVVLVEAKPFRPFPTELMSTATLLREHGIRDVSVISAEDAFSVKADWLVIWSEMHGYNEAVSIARRARAVRVVLTGNYVSCSVIDAMQSRAFHFGILGDPEVALLRLVSGHDPGTVSGVAHRHGGNVVASPRLDLSSDEFPAIDYGLWQSRRPAFGNVAKVREYTLRRGVWAKRKQRGVKLYDRFLRECNQLRSIGIEHLVVEEDEFCFGSQKRRGAISALDGGTWECSASVSSSSSDGFGDDIAVSGCQEVHVLVVSGSARLCHEYGISVDDAEGVLRKMSCAVPHVIVGLPGETVQSLEETREWLRGLGLGATVETFVPLPGSPCYENPDRYRRFGFQVTGVDTQLFDVRGDIEDVPWRCDTIEIEDFLPIRNEMIDEFSGWQFAPCKLI